MRAKLFALSVVATVLVAPALASGNDRIPVLHLAGRALDSQGAPLQDGIAHVLLDTTGTGAESGDLPIVGEADVRDGRFDMTIVDDKLPTPVSPFGARDFWVFLSSSKGTSVLAFTTRGLSARAADGEPAPGADAGLAVPPPSIPKPGEILLPIQQPPPLPFVLKNNNLGVHVGKVGAVTQQVTDLANQNRSSSCHYAVESSFDHNPIFAQIHGYDGLTTHFSYSQTQTADSTFTTFAQGPYGWYVAGTFSMYQSNTRSAGSTLTNIGDKWVSGKFKTNILRVYPRVAGGNCSWVNDQRLTRTYLFEGEVGQEGNAPPKFTGRCDTLANKTRLLPQGDDQTASATGEYSSSTWSFAGLSAGSGSGWSDAASTSYLNRSKKYPRWICGKKPDGSSADFHQAAMVYAGPIIYSGLGVVPAGTETVSP
jgi:hypothetical protein